MFFYEYFLLPLIIDSRYLLHFKSEELHLNSRGLDPRNAMPCNVCLQRQHLVINHLFIKVVSSLQRIAT